MRRYINAPRHELSDWQALMNNVEGNLAGVCGCVFAGNGADTGKAK